MITKGIKDMSKSEIEEYVLELQKIVRLNKDKGYSIDDFLDNTSIFDEVENLLNDEEFAVFILTILNGFDSKVLIDNVVDSIQSSICNGSVGR